MPYRRDGKKVYKKVGGKWKLAATAKSEKNAKAIIRIKERAHAVKRALSRG